MIFTDCLAIRCTHAVVQHQPAGCIFLLQHKAQALAGQLQVAVGCVIEKVCPFARADRDLPGEFPGALNQGLSALRKMFCFLNLKMMLSLNITLPLWMTNLILEC